MIGTNAIDGSSIRGTAEENEEIVVDSDSKFNQKHTEVIPSKAPQNVEVVEQDHTRIRVLDFLVLNIEAACNIIKNKCSANVDTSAFDSFTLDYVVKS